jgi:hypothetical protein
MSLSIKKLESLLADKGFNIVSYFIVHKYCAYVEAISVNNADRVLISIPEKFKFKMHSDSSKYIYRIHSIDMDDEDEVSNDFAGKPTDTDIEKIYDKVIGGISPSITGLGKGGNIASHLEESYHRRISLYDLEQGDIKNLKSLYRQIKRLRFCMQSVRYKLSVIFQNYICILERDSGVDVYQISRYSGSSKKLLTMVDLEFFFEKTESEDNSRIYKDIKTLKDNLYRILNNTQDSHLTMLDKLISTKSILDANIHMIRNKKAEYAAYLEKFETLLQRTVISENNVRSQLEVINKQYRDGGFRGIHSDSNVFMKKNQLENELNKIKIAKEEISKNMLGLRQKNDILYLDTDNTIFDNVVMVAAIFKNVETLVKEIG